MRGITSSRLFPDGSAGGAYLLTLAAVVLQTFYYPAAVRFLAFFPTRAIARGGPTCFIIVAFVAAVVGCCVDFVASFLSWFDLLVVSFLTVAKLLILAALIAI